MKKGYLFLLQWFLLTPCFSQSPDTAIDFFTRQGNTYTGVVTTMTDDSCTVQFEALGLSLLLSTQQLTEAKQQTGNKASKQAMALGDEVEKRLQQKAAMLLGQLLLQNSFPENATRECCFRFSELKDCSLYFFYTTKGYDFVSTDYHIVKVDLKAVYSQNPFSTLNSVQVRNSNNHPVVEIAKHTSGSGYRKEHFYTGADWNNQPQYMTDLRLCFLDESQVLYRKAVEQMGLVFEFLSRSCRRKK